MTKVLFLCYGNACRSIMAEAFARHYWKNGMEAASAGLAPLGYVPSQTIEALSEAGISSDGLYSKSLSDVSLGEMDYIINLTEFEVDRYIPPSFSGRLVFCPVQDPFGQDAISYREARDTIKRLIREKLPEMLGAVNGHQ